MLGKKRGSKRAVSLLVYRMSRNRLDHCFHWLTSVFREALMAAHCEKVLGEHFVSPVCGRPRTPNIP